MLRSMHSARKEDRTDLEKIRNSEFMQYFMWNDLKDQQDILQQNYLHLF